MSLLRTLSEGLRSLFRKEQVSQELDEELRGFLEMAAEEKMKQGMSRRDALRSVRLEQGDADMTREIVRDAGWESAVGTWWQDLRFAARMLRKNLGFTGVAVLTLALGIGANTAIFSYISAWIIKPLPYPQADRLMVFHAHDKKEGWTSYGLTSTASFLDYAQANASFEQIAEWSGWEFNLTGNGAPALVEGGRVSWNYFDVLGAKPALGRTFAAEEDRPGAGHVAILSEGLWQSRFAGDPQIIGRNITISGEAYTVVGVMPGKFQFPQMGIADLWAPLALTDKERADRAGAWFTAFGRLKQGVTRKQAEAESAAIFGRMETQFPATNTNLTLLVQSMAGAIGRNEGTPEVMICFVIVGLILLIACANVANLMLTRATGRMKEFAIRGALGATRGRLVQQLVTESVLLFLLGGMAGVWFGLFGVRWIGSQIPWHIRGYLVNYGRVDLDATTLVFTLGITVLCGLVFGLLPAFSESRLDLNRTLKDTSSQAAGSKRGMRLRRVFVAAEIALAVVVLIATTLLVKSFIISVRSSPGYNAANVLIAQLSLPKTKYAEDWRQRNSEEEVLARIRALPGAIAAGAANSVPFGGFGAWTDIEAVGKPAPAPGERYGAEYTAVSPDYFSAMQIGLLRGRVFGAADAPGSTASVVVNETLAQEFWPKEDALGQQLRFGEERTVCTIVGVVRDIKTQNLRARPRMQIYVPLAQFPSATLGFVVRTAGESTEIGTAVRDAIWAVDRDQPISSVEPLERLMVIVDTGDRVLTKLMVFFGLLAMFLGTIGIYGVMSDQVSQRTHEIGIRTTLGASRGQMMTMVIGQGLKLASIGIVVGAPFALGAARLLQAKLYGVSPSDPMTFIGVPVVFAVVAAAACWLPARRAMRVDPMVALRHE